VDDLPRSELAKLDGPATIDGDSLQVSLHNGTAWELREVVIGLTIVKRPEFGQTNSSYGQARIVPAAAGAQDQVNQAQQDSFQKQPDVTLLLRVKGSAAPAATSVFRTSLNFALFPDQDWHWAIVKAKGIPPQALPDVARAEQELLQPGPGAATMQPAPLPPVQSTAPPLLPTLNPTAATR
jgi:hypothetical protein